MTRMTLYSRFPTVEQTTAAVTLIDCREFFFVVSNLLSNDKLKHLPHISNALKFSAKAF